MRTWTIGKKLYTVIGLLVGLFLLSVGIVYYKATAIEESIASTGKAVIKIEELAELDEQATTLLFVEQAAIVAAFTRDRGGFEQRVHEVDEIVAAVEERSPKIMATFTIQANRDDLAAIDKGLNEWHALFKEVARLAEQGRPDEAQALSNSKSRPLMEANEKLVMAITERVEQQVANSIAANEAATRTLLVSLFAILAAALVVGAVAGYVARSITRALQTIATGLSEGAEQVAAASGQVSTSAQSLSQGSTEQAASLEETSASMEEMAAMTRQNADNARQASTLMADVERQVSQSNDALRGMVGSMASIQESSTKVSKIIKTIDEIAFQTNILALNAAVEAARAGDAGMGFAVVADEVRNLAQRSAQAAKDTASLIEESSANAAQGSEKVEQVAAAITDITTSVGKVKGLVDDVSAASQQQAQGIDQVTQAVGQMEKVTQGTAATAEESAAASEELTAQAETTMGIVRDLEAMVGGGRATPAPERRAATVPVAHKRKSNVLALGRKTSATQAEAEHAIPMKDTGTFGSF